MKKTIYIVAALIALSAIFLAVRPAFALPCYQTSQGGTGDCPTGNVPFGDLLVSNGTGKYTETATSSLGITASASWGSITGTLSNQTDLQNALNAKVGLTSFSALFPLFYNNGTGVFSIEATSSFGCTVSCFASHNVSQWTNDAGYLTSLAGAASSTLLSDNNTFSGANTFSQTITGSVSGNSGTATALQNARTINGVSFNGTGNIVIQAASSTLLGDNNTWSGNNTWTASSTMQKQLNLQGASSTIFTCTTCYGGTLTLTTALPVSSGGTGLTSTSQNFFFAGPTSGSGAPTWRAIVAGDVPTLNQNTTGSAGSVANAVTFNSGGSGASSGSTFNGSSALTVSYNTIGAQVAGTYVTAVNGTTNQITSSGGTSPTLSLPNLVVFPVAASSTLFSNFGTAYFGGTATATINSLGDALFQQATTSSFYDNNVTSALALFDANHREGAFAGSNCSAGAAPTGISAIGAVQSCTTYTQGGITTLGNYASTTGTAISLSTTTASFQGATFGQSISVSPNGILFTPVITGTLTAASSTLLGDNNSFSGNDSFSKLVLLNGAASSTLLSAYGPAYFGGSATSSFATNGQLTLQMSAGTGNGAVCATSGGLLEYSSCANCVTGSSNITLGNYASSTASFFSLSSSTAAFDGVTFGQTIAVSANSVLFTPTFSGNFNGLSHDSTLNGTTYNLSAGVSNWGINLTNANSWTGLQQFSNASSTLFSVFNTAYFGGTSTSTIGSDGSITTPSAAHDSFANASSTNLSASTYLGIPNSSNPQPTVAGQVAESTNYPDQLQYGAGGSTVAIQPQSAFILGIASTTALVASTTNKWSIDFPWAETLVGARCHTDVPGSTAEYEFQYTNPGSAASTPIYFALTSADTYFAVSANNTPAIGATTTNIIGAPVSSPTLATCTWVASTTPV
jgi:hypothetical protein